MKKIIFIIYLIITHVLFFNCDFQNNRFLLTKEYHYGSNDNLKSYYEYIYDSNNLLIKKLHYINDTMIRYNLFEYDKYNSVSQIIEYEIKYKDDLIVPKKALQLDEELQRYTQDTEVLTGTEKYFYNNKNLLIKTEKYYQDKLYSYKLYEYDARENKIKESEIFLSNKQSNIYFNYEYNKNNELIKGTRFYENNYIDYYFLSEYNKGGKLIKRTFYKPDDKIWYTLLFEYDKNKNLVKRINNENDFITYYTFDYIKR